MNLCVYENGYRQARGFFGDTPLLWLLFCTACCSGRCAHWESREFSGWWNVAFSFLVTILSTYFTSSANFSSIIIEFPGFVSIPIACSRGQAHNAYITFKETSEVILFISPDALTSLFIHSIIPSFVAFRLAVCFASLSPHKGHPCGSFGTRRMMYMHDYTRLAHANNAFVIGRKNYQHHKPPRMLFGGGPDTSE